MARSIDYLNKPLSAEDRAYLLSRGRRSEVLVNDRKFAPDGEGADDDVVTWEDEVHAMTVVELKAELGARDLETSGNKAELQERLIEAGPDED